MLDNAGERALSAGVEHSKSGRFEQAREAFSSAESWALDHQEPALADRASVFRIAVEMELGSIQGQAALLQRILLRSHESETCFFAAYNTARCYDLESTFDKAHFYAEVARKWASQTEREDCLAMTHNLFGNLYLVKSSFEQAGEEYEQALELMDVGRSIDRALVLDNLGYTKVVLGEIEAGFTLLYESLRSLSYLGEESLRPRPRLSLCYAYLEIGRNDHAIRQATKALAEARDGGDDTSIKNSLYLLGQANNLEGDPKSARAFFSELQEAFYPDNLQIPDFLLAIDVRKMLHLKV